MYLWNQAYIRIFDSLQPDYIIALLICRHTFLVLSLSLSLSLSLCVCVLYASLPLSLWAPQAQSLQLRLLHLVRSAASSQPLSFLLFPSCFSALLSLSISTSLRSGQSWDFSEWGGWSEICQMKVWCEASLKAPCIWGLMALCVCKGLCANESIEAFVEIQHCEKTKWLMRWVLTIL